MRVRGGPRWVLHTEWVGATVGAFAWQHTLTSCSGGRRPASRLRLLKRCHPSRLLTAVTALGNTPGQRQLTLNCWCSEQNARPQRRSRKESVWTFYAPSLFRFRLSIFPRQGGSDHHSAQHDTDCTTEVLVERLTGKLRVGLCGPASK